MELSEIIPIDGKLASTYHGSMKSPLMIAAAASLLVGIAQANPHTETFDGEAKPSNWKVQFGYWEPAEGALVCHQVEADKHAAASRWAIPMTDGVIEARVKLDGATAFHIGFDPKPGSLDKKGHLYSLIITPQGAQIMKHKDKSKLTSKNVVLAEGKQPIPTGEWIDVRLEAKGNTVMARVGDGINLETIDETFGVPKPTVVFRCIGTRALVDEVTVLVK